MNLSFWRGRRVLVTGHTGFKGAWLCLWLQSLGAEVSGYALAPASSPNLFELARVGDGMASLLRDVRELAALRDALQSQEPELVFHLAAQSLVRESYAHPVDTFATNVMGTANLLEACREAPSVAAVVVVTSDKCYENREWVWGYREVEAMGGRDPYSASKGCAELVTAAYRRSFFSAPGSAAIASARSGNVIGGGDWARDRLVPDLLAAFAAGHPAVIRNPEAIRPWQHVLDPLCGYLRLAQHMLERGAEYAEAWNFGPTDADARQVSWIADRLAARWGNGAAWRHEPGDHPHEAHHLKLDSAKARQRLRWTTILGLEESLDWVLDWHREVARGGDARRVTERQIANYQERAQ